MSTARALRGLHVLADAALDAARDPVEIARAVCAGGAAVVQLRAKRAGDREILAWASAIRMATRAAGVLFVVNDRFDLALAAEADGVHLGQEDLPPERIPAPERARLVVGLSTHTHEQVDAARTRGVDYLGFGPVFGTTSKDSPYAARGLDALAEAVRRAAALPVVAIGGIDASRIEAVARCGAGAAVISAVAAAADPTLATRTLADALAPRT